MQKQIVILALILITSTWPTYVAALPDWIPKGHFTYCDVGGQTADTVTFECYGCGLDNSISKNCNNATEGCRTDSEFYSFTYVKDASVCAAKGMKMVIKYGWVCGIEEGAINICEGNVDTCTTDNDCWNKGYSRTTEGCVNGICDTCRYCGSTTSAWTGTGTRGYQQATVTSCNCNGTQKTNTIYRCAMNYYGDPTSASSGCTACPTNEAGYSGYTDRAGSGDITDCYLYEGDGFKDNIGSGIYTADCYYTE